MQPAAQLSLAAFFVLLPCASACDPGTCNQSEDATTLELLQVVANVSANRGAAHRGALSPERQFPFGDIIGSLPDAITNGVNGVALDGIISLLNRTLQSLDAEAEKLASQCEEYKDTLLGNVSAAGDHGISTLKKELEAQVPPVQALWGTISGAVTAALPPISAALNALGLEDVATPLTDAISDATNAVDQVLSNATRTISSLSNATRAEKDAALEQLNASIASGLASVASLEERLNRKLQQLLTSLAGMLNETAPSSSSPAKISELSAQVEQLVATLTDSLRSLFGGTLAAARAALAPPAKGGAGALVAPLWLLAAIAVSWLS